MKWKLTIVAALVLGCASPLLGQDEKAEDRDAKVAFIKGAAIPVRTIDPADEEFSDLEPLIEKIGKARVVLLGEQSHGDGACFLAKSRLIRFLHQRMGFDVLAFESGMFDMKWVDEGMRNNAPLSEAHRRGLFGIWALSEQCRGLLEYVRETNSRENPLELAGFDSQYSSGDAREEFPKVVEAFFAKAGKEVLPAEQMQSVKALEAWLREFSEGGQPEAKAAAHIKGVEAAIKTLGEKQDVLLRVHPIREVGFMRRCLQNQIEFAKQCSMARTRSQESGNVRDRAMGENLAWLADEYYRGRKVIVWAASMHNMYNAPKAGLEGKRDFYAKTVTMGHVAHEKLGDAMYSIMFLADHGEIGRPWSGAGPMRKAGERTLDGLLHAAGFELAFLDLKTAAASEGGAWLGEALVARPLGYAECEAVWPEQCDAFFFTDEMKPSTLRVEEKPASKVGGDTAGGEGGEKGGPEELPDGGESGGGN